MARCQQLARTRTDSVTHFFLFVIASAAKQSILSFGRGMDCFAALAMTGRDRTRRLAISSYLTPTKARRRLPPRLCEERSDEAIHSFVSLFSAAWIASLRSQ
jgi:hypothetical protein